ncbi:MAG: GAF domain-containing protein [Bdellovibrionaceae bacterium]|nr:GAF domain-containing protein [Pseudobdellovibrionaceae bacterium]
MSDTKRNNENMTEKLKSLIEIGVALSSEKELTNLMQLFLEKCLEVCQAEGASIYLLDKKMIYHDAKNNPLLTPQKIPVLRFLRTMNRLSGSEEHNGIIEINKKSVAGYCALSKKSINISDCYDLPADTPYRFNPQFDQDKDYHTKSLLTVPMVTSQGQVRGVIQIVNKLTPEGVEHLNKDVLAQEEIIPFTANDEELMQVFASQAAVAIENAQLTENIENLFESFVHASVKAIEARDPTTSGHSDRVAVLTVELALAVHKTNVGMYRNVIFSEEQIRELRYAALLHDFGKIGIKEDVLLKQKKLHSRELESILLRLDSMEYKNEANQWKQLIEGVLELVEKKPEIDVHWLQNKVEDIQRQIETTKLRIRQMKSGVMQANEPYVVKDQSSLDRILNMIEMSSEHFGQKILTDNEVKILSIPKGSLSRDERMQIESHVSHTYEFLKQIAWTDGLEHVPQIAHCHHEKMDGSGYPRGIAGPEIPIQARMMTISDIYDALVAFDRPYKKSLNADSAIDILLMEANEGKLDSDLLRIFIEAGVYTHITGLLMKKVA